MQRTKPEYRVQIQAFVKAMDYANNVSEETDFKISKIKEEAFLPRWLTTLVDDELRRQGDFAPDVLNYGGPVFTNTIIEKDGESYYGFDMCNEHTKPDHAPMTVNALNKTVDNYLTLRNHVIKTHKEASDKPLKDFENVLVNLDVTMREWYWNVKKLCLADPAAQLVKNLNEKGIAVKTLDDLQSLKGDAFDRFRELDMPNIWIALNPHVKGFKNDFIVPQKFWDFENSYAQRIQNRFAEPAPAPAPAVVAVEDVKPNRPKMKM
ncbi:hypothetical protein AO073_01575 [Pseudomonas syringae ICMP 11293]|uniref:hypothetical protein n=1 Tax=Pseudomonas syringae TaxID=317 RepID=UPI00072FB9F9|nr:hypothetical protein [Pseudomonas syringae]KTB91885.1 hypothetical protein AO073_01575 [Pseudomonas syringae ICMP 11293]